MLYIPLSYTSDLQNFYLHLFSLFFLFLPLSAAHVLRHNFSLRTQILPQYHHTFPFQFHTQVSKLLQNRKSLFLEDSVLPLNRSYMQNKSSPYNFQNYFLFPLQVLRTFWNMEAASLLQENRKHFFP